MTKGKLLKAIKSREGIKSAGLFLDITRNHEIIVANARVDSSHELKPLVDEINSMVNVIKVVALHKIAVNKS